MATASTAPLRLRLARRAGRAALSPGLALRLTRAIEGEAAAPAIFIEGRPGSFCEGLALEPLASGGFAPRDAEEAATRYADLIAAIERTPRPVVALVDGPALGGGAGIAAAADLVIASPRATFALPETLLGLIPAAAFPPIARRVGVARARRLALGAPPLDAEEARLAGLADQVAVDLEAAADAHVRRFARLDPRAVGAMKTLVARHFAAPPAYAADARAAFVALLGSEATAGRIRRFAAGLAPWADDEDEGEGEGEGGE